VNRLSPQMAGLRLLLAVILALIAGFIFGVRWAVSMDTSDHRRYLPPVPAELAFTPFPSPPAPTLPATCCRPDDEPEQPTISAPDSSSPDVTQPADKGIPVPSPAVVRAAGAFQVRGYATWHATGRNGLYAAAGPALRRMLGPGWRNELVLVVKGRKAVQVRLSDWCACGRRHGEPTLLDLSDEVYDYLGRLSSGIMHVTVEGFR